MQLALPFCRMRGSSPFAGCDGCLSPALIAHARRRSAGNLSRPCHSAHAASHTSCRVWKHKNVSANSSGMRTAPCVHMER